LANVELDAVTLTQILEPFAIHRTPVEEVFVSSIALDEPKPLVDSQRSNLSRHHRTSLDRTFRGHVLLFGPLSSIPGAVNAWAGAWLNSLE